MWWLWTILACAFVIWLLGGCADDGGVDLSGLDTREERCAWYETAFLALSVGRESHNADQKKRLDVYETFLLRFCGGAPEDPAT